MKNISLYKSLDSDFLKEHFKVNYNYSFKRDDLFIELKVIESDAGSICLEAEDGNWDSINDGISINFICDCNNLHDCYYAAYNDTIIGLCALIYSNESKFRKCVELFNFSKKQNDISINKKINIPSHTITGVLSIELQLFVKKSGTGNDFGINNNQGAIIGKFGNLDVILSGDGSLFPIVNVSRPGQPLWNFIFDFQEPDVDLFVDKCKLEINTAHKDFKLLDVNSDFFCDRLFIEVMQGTVIQFLSILRDENRLSSLDETFLDGTVMQVAKYLVKTHGIKVDSIEAITMSVKDYFEKNGGLN